MNKSKLFVAITAAILILSIAGIANARNVASYSMVVPKVGGSSYTAALTKVNNTRGVDNNTSNGGGYTMYTAIYHPNTTRVTPQFTLTSGSRILITYNTGQNYPATGYRLGHTNYLTTYVDVSSSGSWSPDEN